MTFFAQIENVPSETLKWVLVVLFALLGVAGIVLGIINGARKQSIHIEPQPVEVRKLPKRYNHDQAEQRHDDTTRRLNAHDAEIDKLWETMRAEDAAIRKESAEHMRLISRSLGRIEGKLQTRTDSDPQI